MLDFIRQAAKLNEEGIKVPKSTTSKKEIPVPAYFLSLLKKNKTTKMIFEEFSPSQRREYLEWITEAKTEATRLKRMQTAIEWIREGKHWKYETKKN
jgi:uncharacterized protein YdeI (YjbR/CyaY-like superfamily)